MKIKMIEQAVSLWRNYIRSRPFKTVGFIYVMTLLTSLAASDDLSTKFRMFCGGAIVVMIVCCSVSCWKFQKAAVKVVACFLASMFIVSPWSIALAEDSYAGYSGQSCYCLEEDNITAASASELEDNVVVINFVVEQIENAPSPLVIDAVPRVISIRHPDPKTLVSWDKFAQTFASQGIDINRSSSTQYAKNGQPVSATSVPFRFGGWSSPLVIFPDRTQYNVVIETTSDCGEFAQWQPVSRLSIPANVPIQYQDTPDGRAAFYRIRIEQPYVQAGQQEAGPVLLGCGLGLLVGVGYIAAAAIRACAKNKKKFDDMKTNGSPSTLTFTDAYSWKM